MHRVAGFNLISQLRRCASLTNVIWSIELQKPARAAQYVVPLPVGAPASEPHRFLQRTRPECQTCVHIGRACRSKHPLSFHRREPLHAVPSDQARNATESMHFFDERFEMRGRRGPRTRRAEAVVHDREVAFEHVRLWHLVHRVDQIGLEPRQCVPAAVVEQIDRCLGPLRSNQRGVAQRLRQMELMVCFLCRSDADAGRITT